MRTRLEPVLEQVIVRPPVRLGRRKGDAILLAWNYAKERGDLEVAAQLEIEYENVRSKLPASVVHDRRRKPSDMNAALRDLWSAFKVVCRVGLLEH